MSQPKVYEFAKEVGLETLALMDKIREWNLPIKNHMADLDEEMVEEIRSRLNALKEQKNEADSKKKKTKKKKTASAGTAKKTATKKKQTVRKVVTATSKSDEESKVAKKKTKKVSAKARTVIRRKGGEKEEQDNVISVSTDEIDSLSYKSSAAAAPELNNQGKEIEQETVLTNSDLIEQQDQVDMMEQESEGLDNSSPTEVKPRRNIVGRMDLKRVARPTGGNKSETSNSSNNSSPSSQNVNAASSTPLDPSARRQGAGRSLRTGFVASTPYIDEPSKLVEDKDDRLKKKPGAGKETTAVNFSASEFRKREVVFQPKKKRILGRGEAKKTQLTTPKASKRVVKIHGVIKVSELANQMNLKAPQLIKKLMSEGEMATMNSDLDFDTVSLIVPEFGFEAVNVLASPESLIESLAFGDLEGELVPRTPVVTVMGHVDHGKTTLLDSIRNADVASREAGGITQHIGAYQVTTEDGHQITFIDTPGHAAFTAMRARGANSTDVAIIVVAADDGVMPQTVEAISHAKAAGVPIIVAINKMDRPGANPDRIKQQLTEYELVPEEWGGSTIFCPVSALKGDGIKELLEQIHLVAEVQELRANPNRSAMGVVIESSMEKGRGSVATLLVQDGTLEVGQSLVVGLVSGRVRAMNNDRREQVKSAGPGTPVEIIGLPGTPQAGDRFDVTKTEEGAREVAELRKKKIEAEAIASNKALSLDQIFSKVKSGGVKELSVVLKADVAGSLEAVKGMFEQTGTDEVKVKIVHSGVGGVSESDVLLAGTSQGIVIGFNVRPDMSAQKIAKEKGIEIKCYTIIYELIDDVKKALSGLLDPDITEVSLGRAEVRDTFTVPKMGVIAGCSVVDGKISRNNQLRLVRDGRIIFEGKVSSLKRFKDDVKEVATGFECGIGIENFNDIKVGDVIEAFDMQSTAREL